MKLQLLPPGHTGPVCRMYRGPDVEPAVGPELVPVEGGNTRQVAFEGVLYIAFNGNYLGTWTQADKDYSYSLGYPAPEAQS